MRNSTHYDIVEFQFIKFRKGEIIAIDYAGDLIWSGSKDFNDMPAGSEVPYKDVKNKLVYTYFYSESQINNDDEIVAMKLDRDYVAIDEIVATGGVGFDINEIHWEVFSGWEETIIGLANELSEKYWRRIVSRRKVLTLWAYHTSIDYWGEHDVRIEFVGKLTGSHLAKLATTLSEESA